MNNLQIPRYFIKLDYNGTSFHGWQIQPNSTTVQEIINLALSTILRDNINVVGAGRTDTGVHAKNFVAHFNSSKINDNDLVQLCFKLNSFLPKDINIQSISKVAPDAHSRFDATARTYRYYATYRKDVFNYPFSLFIHRELDIDKMNEAASKLFDYEDFTSFSKVNTDTKTNNCKIMFAQWEYKDAELIFTIKADRFLRNMVRAIVGTLIEVGQHKISVDNFCKIIELKNRSKAGSSAPGKALFLEKIDYPYNF